MVLVTLGAPQVELLADTPMLPDENDVPKSTVTALVPWPAMMVMPGGVLQL
jgi:hypothetical protein